MADAGQLSPTFTGHIATLHDAHLLIECCLRGLIESFPRRLSEFEQGELVRNGSVFVYEEDSSGIKRWTDGKRWSASRKAGYFLVYQEKEKKPRMSKRSKDPNERPLARSMIGSEDGNEIILKKCLAVTLGRPLLTALRFHLISYYTIEGVDKLCTPSSHPFYQSIKPRPALTESGLAGRSMICQPKFFSEPSFRHQSGNEGQIKRYKPSLPPLLEASGDVDVPELLLAGDTSYCCEL
jgi:hypothetical protein